MVRPKSITIFCSIFAIFQLFALSGAFHGLLIALGVLNVPFVEETNAVNEAVANLTVPGAMYGVLANGLTLLSLAGLWHLRRWGIYLFGGIVLAGALVTYIITPSWVVKNELAWWIPLILPTIYLLIVLLNWRQFKGGLTFT